MSEFFLKTMAPRLLTFLFAMITWVVLSGKFDVFHLSMGVVSSALVAYFSSDLLFPSSNLKGFFRTTIRFLLYLPWLLYQVMLANIHVLYLVFHPRMMDLIDPQIIRFNSRLRKDMSHLIFANSITLTPGTITIYVSIYGDYTIHAIDEQSGEVLPGDMEIRVGRVFEE